MPRSRRTGTTLNIRQLALIGARARLVELETERQAIFKAFPQLSRARLDGTGAERVPPKADGGSSEAVHRRRKRRMSAEGRKRIADAAKRRWAEWRKQNRA